MRENFVQSMAKQVEAQTHEESKFWRASQPLPNQSSMQGRESEKKSNIQQCRMAMRNAQKEYKLQDREQNCEKLISHPMQNLASLAKPKLNKMNFAPYAKFHKPCENPPM